jgi:hypothetical protein
MAIFTQGSAANQIFSTSSTSNQIFYSTGTTRANIYGTSTTVAASFAANAYAVTVVNTGATKCFVMGSTATANGVPLNPGDQLTLISTPATPISALYAITASGTTITEAALVSMQSVA